jgi:hypothetical protein
MSSRTVLRPHQVITAGAMVGDLTSAVTILQSVTKISYACVWTGTSPVGTVSIQASNDYSVLPNGVVDNAGTWTTLTLAYNGNSVTTIPVTGNTGNGIIDVVTAAYAVRLIYTHTSGTGSLTVTISGKIS